MSDVINALKRLERAGSEDSVATRKLCEAAETLAARVVELLPPVPFAGVLELPSDWQSDGYRLRWTDYDKTYDVGSGAAPDRQAALQFAVAIADGWLDQLAAWLESRTADSDAAAARLRAASKALQG